MESIDKTKCRLCGSRLKPCEKCYCKECRIWINDITIATQPERVSTQDKLLKAIAEADKLGIPYGQYMANIKGE